MQIKVGAIAAAVVGVGLLGWMLLARADRNDAAASDAAISALRAEFSALRSPSPPAPVAAAPSAAAPNYPDQSAEVAALRLQILQLQAQLAAAQDETRRHRE